MGFSSQIPSRTTQSGEYKLIKSKKTKLIIEEATKHVMNLPMSIYVSDEDIEKLN